MRFKHYAVATMAIAISLSAKGQDHALRDGARTQGNALVRGASEHARLDPASRPGHAMRLAALTQTRKATMLTLAARDPHGFLLNTMPPSVRERLPAVARAGVEQSVDVEGILRLAGGRGADGRPFHRMWFETLTGSFALELAGRTAGDPATLALANRRIRLTGSQLDTSIVAAGATGVVLLDATASGAPTAAGTTDLGNQTTLIAMINFADSAVGCSAADAAARVFGATQSVTDLYRESTRGLVTFSGQAIGPFTIPYSAASTTCDINGYTTAALAAIAQAGHDAASYRRVMFVMPPVSGCPAGLGNLGGALPTRTWIFRCSATDIMAHELGHNLQLNHAATPAAEYGDYSDPMGAPGRLVQHHGANRAMSGWLPAGASGELTAGGTYAVDPLTVDSSGMPQALRVRKADSGEYYYLSTRVPSGYDANLATGYRNTLSVHIASGTLPSRTILVATLGTGQSFTDAVNGISITNRQNSSGRITFDLAMGAASCARRPPAVALAPILRDGAPGAALAYSLAVTNNDSPACGSSSFALGQTLPAGFSGGFASSTLAIAPGITASMAWTITSPAGAAEGTYTVQASAAHSLATATSGSYVVVAGVTPAPDTIAPVVTITSPTAGSTLRDKGITINATATDNVAVKQVEFYVDGALIGTTSAAPYSVRWNTRRASRGAHTILVRARDAAGNAATQSIGVTLQ